MYLQSWDGVTGKTAAETVHAEGFFSKSKDKSGIMHVALSTNKLRINNGL